MLKSETLKGRELDIFCAEILLEQDRVECRQDPMTRNGEPQFYWGYAVGHDFAPEYRNDFTAAFTLVEHIKKQDKSVQEFFCDVIAATIDEGQEFLFALTPELIARAFVETGLFARNRNLT